MFQNVVVFPLIVIIIANFGSFVKIDHLALCLSKMYNPGNGGYDMNFEDNKLVVGRNVKLIIDGTLSDKGVIIDTGIAVGSKQPRVQIEVANPEGKQQFWFGYIERDGLNPGWRYLTPDPLVSTVLTFSKRGPIYEIIPTI